ncbi:MAG: DUF2970 domain-containing protein [Gammaproteobacteria bacterium]|nr:DUF2970 domain-containing protein [Gammaproteobacteria bacterium]
MTGPEEQDDQRDATDPEQRDDEAPTEVSFWTLVISTLGAAIGVQSRANKERDFRSGRVAPFIVAGILFTVLFVATIVVVVKLVLGSVG